MQAWVEVEVAVSPDLADPLSSLLFEWGSTGTEIEESNDEVVLRAYFPAESTQAANLRDAVVRYLRAVGMANPRICVRTLGNQNWEDCWKRWFTPVAVGQRLWIKPPWITETLTGRTSVVIEPGMAFGTGHHPSTIGCLELLEGVVGKIPVRRALDLGTGSGILAIALAKLGVPLVHAVDIDPHAAAIARRNCVQNGVADKVRVATDWPSDELMYDCIVANLYRNALLELAPKIVSHLDEPAAFICAGFLAPDETFICSAYESLGCTLEERWEREDWVTLSFKKEEA